MMRHHDERVEFLREVPLFAGLRRRQVEQVASLTTGITVPAGTVLCEEGHWGQEFFLLESGEVEVSTGTRLGPGEFFGEMALLANEPRSATVATTRPSKVLVASRQEFAGIREVDRRVGAVLARTVDARRAALS